MVKTKTSTGTKAVQKAVQAIIGKGIVPAQYTAFNTGLQAAYTKHKGQANPLPYNQFLLAYSIQQAQAGNWVPQLHIQNSTAQIVGGLTSAGSKYNNMVQRSIALSISSKAFFVGACIMLRGAGRNAIVPKGLPVICKHVASLYKIASRQYVKPHKNNTAAFSKLTNSSTVLQAIHLHITHCINAGIIIMPA